MARTLHFRKKTQKKWVEVLSPTSFFLKGELDFKLMAAALGLLVFGWVMVYSSSAMFAVSRYQDQFFFLKKQVMWSMVGLGFFLAAGNLPSHLWQRAARVFYGVSLVGLVLVLFLGPEIAGARRWLRLGPVGIQPSEIAKFALILVTADYLDRRQSRLREFKKGLLPLLGMIGFPLLLILIEPDLGTPVLISGVVLCLLILGGARFSHLFLVALSASPFLLWAVLKVQYRLERLFAYLDPWSDPYGKGYQLIQSLLALGSGGIFGKGIGNSQIKIAHLPDAHTDFVFAVLGEELGLFGTLLCAGLFLFLCMRGLKISRNAKTLFSSLLAAGISLLLGFQAAINMGVASGLFPTKGMPLPFLSFGGSSLVITMLMVGVLIQIGKEGRSKGKSGVSD